ncbi:hypothetical protein mRhiFer1_010319 [Rhinolophus ferrumequinum]|uniref:Small ribosomal subunit protein uS5 n=1 Tax=Rhinolophus ferrumequinum TaxID=59479 RepID=A0A7J7X6M5_RHIFE|nr:hypothetical protein mRhiFer1_010319 [Rhinolophus ferrumequinum]
MGGPRGLGAWNGRPRQCPGVVCGHGAGGGKAEDNEWIAVTKLGRLVKDMKIKSLEEIHVFSLPIREFEIVDFFLGSSLKGEILKIVPVQKQTRADQRTPFKAFVAIGDCSVHGTGIVSAPVPKKLLLMAGIHDCYTSARAALPPWETLPRSL